MKHRAVLLDTSFFLRFLDEGSPLFKNADAYFRYFLEQEITMMISTISIAEYCVGGEISELPLLNLQIVPFNLDHSKFQFIDLNVPYYQAFGFLDLQVLG
ncbi:MAG: hypothetical protein NTV01_16095 [Bacteroidia bacterium]|nr:hypothetical protein [Bacteroidia bacterium]